MPRPVPLPAPSWAAASAAPGTGSPAALEQEPELLARFTDDAKEAEASLNKTVMSQVTEQVATENSEKAVELRDKGDVTGARKALEDNALYLNKQKSALGSGAMAAPSASIQALDKLEAKSREAAESLDGEEWGKTRKTMRQDQHRAKVQQSY